MATRGGAARYAFGVPETKFLGLSERAQELEYQKLCNILAAARVRWDKPETLR